MKCAVVDFAVVEHPRLLAVFVIGEPEHQGVGGTELFDDETFAIVCGVVPASADVIFNGHVFTLATASVKMCEPGGGLVGSVIIHAVVDRGGGAIQKAER